ncbi:hypothetical protein [Flammeovirga sp. EKP202]|uniref:hypothetical protein n=1 Tax=Flammeovirga sp. EKP202 TaxID=2770592 RepID=UPI00165F956A|nr:hypothetical protein [Flammeovirga sp. EKP202]MBD0403638.1 hypothetical protein [Flammeovirga sp. EKP202]
MQKTSLILTILLITCHTFSFGQNQIISLDSQYISKYVEHFTINENGLKGKGYRLLEEKTKNSQFFVLGEYHGSSQISKLTEALVPMLAKNNYTVATFEIGPNSANKLTSLTVAKENIVEQLHTFYSNYYYEDFDNISIPFFDAVEDAKFLNAFSKHHFKIWGCDQEYYNSTLFLGDMILEKSKNRKDILEISKAWNEAKKEIITLYRKDIDEDIQLFEEIQKDEKYVAFTNYFDENDTTAFQILNDMKESWAIYTNYRKSHKDRVKLIRRNFLEQYLIHEQTPTLNISSKLAVYMQVKKTCHLVIMT